MQHQLFSTKIFDTKRLLLRPLNLNDVEYIFSIRSNDTVNKYIERKKCNSPKEALDFIEMTNNPENNALYRAIVLKDMNKAIGGVCLVRPDFENNICELGYELLPTFQKQGFMAEAVPMIINYALEDLRFASLQAHIHELNSSSLNLARKLGFTELENSSYTEEKIRVFSYSIKK